MKSIGRFLLFLLSLGFLGAFAAVLIFTGVIYKYGQSLPDFSQLKDYKPPVVTRVHAADGRFLAEFAAEKRIFVPVDEIPPLVKHSFISAEDQNFYSHKGVDLTAVLRAVVTNFRSSGKRQVGGSTITQQVAKNFLLGNERSYERKIREAILAFRMENSLSKDRLLELYMNEIFLGNRSYGVAAAGMQYFNKTLNELTIPEAAYLAALPKAPNNYHPVRNHEAALARRNWVIDRLADDGYITPEQVETAKATPLLTVPRSESDVVNAPYYAEEVRRELSEKFGADSLYRGGLSARTSLDPQLQSVAETALQNGLMAYDRRHGWRGAVGHIDLTDWQTALASFQRPEGILSDWYLAVVTSAKAGRVEIAFTQDGQDVKGQIRSEDIQWAKGKPLQAGDIVMVQAVPAEDVRTRIEKDLFYLRQIPLVQGAIVAIDPNTGRVIAMQGGWKAGVSGFNRATQAQRQPGSAFKPFIYLAALDKGYTPSSIIYDTPISFTDTAGNVWNPENYSDDFLGATPLRVGVEKSRNLMTIRLAQAIGIDSVVEYAKNFGINDNMKPHLANALGSTETTLIKLTTAYAMIVNGGKKISPVFVDRVQDRYGKTIENADTRICASCGPLVRWENQATPDIADNRAQIGDPRTCYQMVSILEGVVQRGTAKSLASLDRPLAGKTGTTNDSKDTWFIGFTPDLAIGVFVGFDEPKSLGEKETGGSVAAPIFKEFIAKALKDVPPSPFRVPPGVRMVQVNVRTGKPTSPADPNAIWEAFVTGTEPNNETYYDTPQNIDNPSATTDDVYHANDTLPAGEMLEPNPDAPTPLTGTGGIY